MIKLTLLSLLISFATTAFAQRSRGNLSIDIIAHPSISKKYNVYIKRQGVTINIIVTRVDSLNYADFRKNKEFLPLFDSLSTIRELNSKDPREHDILEKLNRITESYTTYLIDSVAVSTKDYKDYNRLLDSIALVPEDTLTQPLKNKNRLILDGIRFQIIVKVKGQITRDFYVNTPNRRSNRMVRRLISESLEVFRKTHPGAIADKKFTYGY